MMAEDSKAGNRPSQDAAESRGADEPREGGPGDEAPFREESDCDRFAPFLDRFVAGLLPDEERVRVEGHLGRCLRCRLRVIRTLRGMEHLDDLLRSALGPPAHAPGDFRRGISTCVRCMENPETMTCPRLLRSYLKLAPSNKEPL